MCQGADGKLFQLFSLTYYRCSHLLHLLDGCNFCNGYNCVSNGAPICGSPCSNNNGCRGAVNGCTLCLNGRCSRGDNRVCVNSASTLQSSLQTGGNVEICGGSLIKLTNEIITSTNNILLTCGGGTCTISGNGSNRLIHFTGGNIQIRGIIFEGGRADGDVSIERFIISVI